MLNSGRFVQVSSPEIIVTRSSRRPIADATPTKITAPKKPVKVAETPIPAPVVVAKSEPKKLEPVPTLSHEEAATILAEVRADLAPKPKPVPSLAQRRTEAAAQLSLAAALPEEDELDNELLPVQKPVDKAAAAKQLAERFNPPARPTAPKPATIHTGRAIDGRSQQSRGEKRAEKKRKAKLRQKNAASASRIKDKSAPMSTSFQDRITRLKQRAQALHPLTIEHTMPADRLELSDLLTPKILSASWETLKKETRPEALSRAIHEVKNMSTLMAFEKHMSALESANQRVMRDPKRFEREAAGAK